MREFLTTLKMPLLFEVLNQLGRGVLNSQLGAVGLVDSVSIVITGAIVAWAGWIVARRSGSVGKSAIAGIAMWFLSLIVIAGGWILLEPIFVTSATMTDALSAFAGLTVSCLLFSPVSILLGVVGGFVAKRQVSMGP
jgi:hypothetical protein